MRGNRFGTDMKVVLLDGYTDEPACLGVPPYVSPYVRLCYGAAKAAGAEVRYVTVDQWRAGAGPLPGGDLLAVVRNVAVPGKYIRGMPASDRELATICEGFKGARIGSLGVGPGAARKDLLESFDLVASGDLDATLFDAVATKSLGDRRRTQGEWESWLVRGAEACAQHPDIWGPLIAEVQMYRGCVRYISGGCSFCTEPLYDKVSFRDPGAILEEFRALARAGVRNYRLGAQSCVYCYQSEEVGRSETPKPNPEAVSSLLKAISEGVRPEVFHLDNANPAVVAEHPEEARRITKAIAEHCTSGNVLAFGLESADPAVAKANNLNATAEQTLEAVRLVNEIGRAPGPTGLPMVLPGINILCGLLGETKGTYDLDFEFLKQVLDEGLSLRRINIRQVMPSRREFPGVRSKEAFSRFKRRVREEIDLPMLERIVPAGTVLNGVYTELREGGRTFGRQVGSYPILVGLPYPFELGKKIDVAVTGHGPRSVGGLVHPTDANTATLSMLGAIPGIGKKRAMAIVRKRPFRKPDELWALFDEPIALGSAKAHLSVGK
jgi:radical SAM superfamily enzyme with C-terminal helix-hairpin-helix motif